MFSNGKLRRLPAIERGLANAGQAKAQYGNEFPGLGVGQMWQNEINFQKQFDQWAWKASVDLARHLRETGQKNPFNAMTISKSLTEGNQAFEAYIHNSQVNSAKTSQAIANWNNGAIQGNATYQAPYGGPAYNLPYTHNTYHINQYGQAAPGYNSYYQNIYPSYGR